MLTICHLLHQEPHRHKVIKRINDLFISLKRKLLNTAKSLSYNLESMELWHASFS